MRRWLIAILTVWYALVSTQAAYVAADFVFPRTQRVPAESPCANQGCGCPAEEQRASRCCCAGEKKFQPPDLAVNDSTLASAECAGLDPKGLKNFGEEQESHPSVPAMATVQIDCVRSPDAHGPTLSPLDRIDKIPI